MQLWGTFKEVVGVGVHKSAHSEGVLTFSLSTFEYSCKLIAERTSVVRLVNLHVPWARGPQRPAAGPRPIGLGGRILAGSGFS